MNTLCGCHEDANARGGTKTGRLPGAITRKPASGTRNQVEAAPRLESYAAALCVGTTDCSSAIEPRLENITATLSRTIESTTTAMRVNDSSEIVAGVNGAARMPTRFITLIIGLSAGPAVSLNGSPTVSPTTVAL